jgi:hypothetical protein
MAGLTGLLAAIGGLAGAGTAIGSTVYNAVSQPGPQTPTTPAPTPPSTQTLDQQKALVSQQLPNVIGATSGLASPSYDSLISQILAGVSGQSGANAAGAAATGQAFQAANGGGAGTGNPIVNNQVPNLSDFLSSFTG